MDTRIASSFDWELVPLEILLAVGLWNWMLNLASGHDVFERMKRAANAFGVLLVAFVIVNGFSLHLPRFFEILCTAIGTLAVATFMIRRLPSWLLPIGLICLALETLLVVTGVSFWHDHFGALGELVGQHFYGLGFVAGVAWLLLSLTSRTKSGEDIPHAVDDEAAHK